MTGRLRIDFPALTVQTNANDGVGDDQGGPLPVMECAYLWCARTFTPRRSTRRYCSDACRVADFHHRQRAAERQKIIDRRPDRWCEADDCVNPIGADERPDKRFCSPACRQAHWRRHGGVITDRTTAADIAALTEETNANGGARGGAA